jgi:hypothetical protein
VDEEFPSAAFVVTQARFSFDVKKDAPLCTPFFSLTT